jgi:hypothetical protein
MPLGLFRPPDAGYARTMGGAFFPARYHATGDAKGEGYDPAMFADPMQVARIVRRAGHDARTVGSSLPSL